MISAVGIFDRFLYGMLFLDGGTVVRLLALSQQEGSGFDSQSPLCTVSQLLWAELACLLCVCVGSLQVLQLPPTVHNTRD